MTHVVIQSAKINILKRIRVSKGLSQKELSAITGIPIKCIGNYEQSVRSLDKASGITLYRLSLALNCNMEDFISEYNNKS